MSDGKYSLDISGKSPSNLVPEELHSISSGKVFIVKAGTCYTESLVVKQDGRTLIRGLDYRPVIFNASAAELTGLEVHSGILLTSIESQAPLSLTYQAVGGEYSGHQQTILDLIEKLGLETNMILYGDLIGIPDTFAPAWHPTEGKDLTGLAELIAAIERTTDALTSSQKLEIAQLRDKLDGKVDRGGSMTLRPDGGTIVVPDDAKTVDIAIPRSISQNANVSLELTFMYNTQPFKAVLMYTEVLNSCTNVGGFYTGPNVLGNPISVAARAGNANVTLLRLGNLFDTDNFISHLHISMVTTTDVTVNDLYGSVTYIETPSELDFDPVEVYVASDNINPEDTGEEIITTGQLQEQIDKLTETIATMSAAINNVNETIDNGGTY